MDNFNEFQKLLILEKRIAQISSTIEVTFGFDIIKTTHADDRSEFAKRGLSGGNQNPISNAEMSEFVSYFKRDIAEGKTYWRVLIKLPTGSMLIPWAIT